jgi:glycosyltransferase involved in cell wall biosynthesis
MAGESLLLVLPEYPPAVGGMQTHAAFLCHHLARRGYRLEVLTYRPATREEQAAAADEDRRVAWPVRRILSRIGHRWNLRLVEARARATRPALIYASTVFYGALARHLPIPVVCRSVGNDVLRPWIAWPYPWGSRLLSYWRLERSLLRLVRRLHHPDWLQRMCWRARHHLMQEAACAATAILPNSGFTEQLLHAIGVDPARLVRVVGGVEASLYAARPLDPAAARARFGLPPGAPIVTTACRLVDKKAVGFLIDTFAERGLPRRGWHLCVVGDGPRRVALTRQAAARGLAGHVTFTGVLPHGETPVVYAASDVVVLASRVQVDARRGVADAETMGRVLLEANAAGIPVVATDAGGVPSVVEDGINGLLFRPDDPDGLVACLERALAGGPAIERMVAEGRRRARDRFDWSVVTDLHEQVFRRHMTRMAGTRVSRPELVVALG